MIDETKQALERIAAWIGSGKSVDEYDDLIRTARAALSVQAYELWLADRLRAIACGERPLP